MALSKSRYNFLAAIALALTTAYTSPLLAETYYVAAAGQSKNLGSETEPWITLTAALKSGKLTGGDTVILKGGEYGASEISGIKFRSPVRIVGETDAEAHFQSIHVKNSRNIHFQNLKIWPDHDIVEWFSIVQTQSDSPNIEFSGIDLRSRKDAVKYRNWNQNTWLTNRANGFDLSGPKNTVRNSSVIGTRFAITLQNDGSQAVANRISGFSGDALRALADDIRIANNYVTDCVAIDGNHDDGIQSWTTGPNGKINNGVMKNLLIENNSIFEWTGKRSGLSCTMQGMFLSEKIQGLIIRNNTVSVSAYHGISVSGPSKAKIANNTLVNSLGPRADAPWIGVFGAKQQDRILIANNIAPKFNVQGNIDYRSPELRNLTLVYPAQELRAPMAGDLRPARGSQLINAGNADFAPRTDLDGTPRSLGGAPDIGAYEVE